MPATANAVNACGVVIKIDDETGTLVDCSGSANEFSLSLEKNIESYKIFGDENHYRLECGKDAEIELTVLFTTADDESSDIIERWYHQTGGERTVEIYLPNNTSGGSKYSCEGLLESYEVSGKADDAKPMMLQAKILPSGGLDWERITG